jgi:nucleoside-diphosphate-sugar epimerase
MSKYALFGATGAVGTALAPILAEANVPFRVVGRSLERLRQRFAIYEPLVEYHAADLNDRKSAVAGAAGVDTVIYLVGVPYPEFARHPQLIQVALNAAAECGVQRFLHLSTVYPYGMPERSPVDESHPRRPHTFKGKMRKEQEDLVLAAHGRAGMRTAVLRPPDFYGPTSELSFVRAVFDAALHGGTANVIGPVDTPHEFIFVPDLAATIWSLSNNEEAYGSAWNVAGPGTITTRRFAELVFASAGQRPKLRVAGKMTLRLLGIFNPFLREVAEMHYLWTNPVVLDDGRLRTLLPDLKKTPYEDGIEQTLRALRAHVSPH